jgi:hypothetical protein
MNRERTAEMPAADQQPIIVKRIGKTTYHVKVFFSKTSKESMTDKILRMLRNEVSQSPKM